MFKKEIHLVLERIHELDLPPPSNSHHQDDYIFSRESLQTFICNCFWTGSRSDTWALVILSFKPLPNMLPLTSEKGLLHTQCHHMHMLSVSAYCQLPSNSLRVWIALQAGSQIFTNREKDLSNGCFQKYGKTPKSSILIGFSITNHPFWGTPYFLEPPKYGQMVCVKL